MTVLTGPELRVRRISVATAVLAVVIGGSSFAASIFLLPMSHQVLASALGMVVAFCIGVQGIRTDCGWNAAMRCAGPSSADSSTLAVHSVGVVLGSLTTGCLLWFTGLVLPIPSIVIAISFLALGIARIFRPNTLAPWGWKVRRHWESWGTRRYMFTFGFCIGLGFLTTMASPVFIALAMYGTRAGLAMACLTLSWFAIGRLSTTWIVAIRDAGSGADVSRTADRVQKAVKYVGVAEALVAIGIGVTLLV